MNKLFQTVCVLALAIGAESALAADLPSIKGEVKAPAPLWTGLYLGLNGGYGWSQTNGFDYYTFQDGPDLNPINNNPSWVAQAGTGTGRFGGGMGGFFGGGQLGYNYQYAPSVVLGLEADLQGVTGNSIFHNAFTGAPFNGTPPAPLAHPSIITALTGSKNLDYFGTIRGRIGYLVTPTLLGYVTGGVAYGQIGMSNRVTSFSPEVGNVTIGGDSFSGVRAGWTAGAGLEWSLNPNWSLKAEYLYYDLGATTSEFGLTTYAPTVAVGDNLLTTRASTHFDGHIVRVGVNYHINWGSAAVASTRDDAPEAGEKDDPSYYWKPYLTKIEAYGGGLHEGYPDKYWAGQGGVAATVVYPFSKGYALQLDGLLAGETNSLVPGLSGHLYWTDGKTGALGAYMESGWRSAPGGGQGDFKFGGEGAWFQDKYTLSGILGFETQSLNADLPGYACSTAGGVGCFIGFNPAGRNFGLFDGFGNLQQNVGEDLFKTIRFFDHVEADYYVNPDFKLSVGHEYTGGINSGVLGGEYLFDTGNGIAPSVFVEGSVGQRGVASLLAGVRFYFGDEGPKSLQTRLREDDPTVHLRRGLNSSFSNARSQPIHHKSTPYGYVPPYYVSQYAWCGTPYCY